MNKIISILFSILILIAATSVCRSEDGDHAYYDEDGMYSGELFHLRDVDQYSSKVFNESDQLVGILNYNERQTENTMGVVTHGMPEKNAEDNIYSSATNMTSFEAGTVNTRHYLQRYYTRKDGYELLVQFWHYMSTPPSIKYGVGDPSKPRIYDVRFGVTNHNLTLKKILVPSFYLINKGNFTWSQWQELESALKADYGSKPAIYYKDNGPYISSW